MKETGVYGKCILHMITGTAEKRCLLLLFLVLKFIENEVISIDKTEKFLSKNKSISHLALVHCETSSGILNPLNEIALLCKKYKTKLIVDAMSSFGGININIQKNNIDALISSANKCLEGIPGFSFSIIKKNSLLQSKGNANSLSLDLFDQWTGFLKNIIPPVSYLQHPRASENGSYRGHRGCHPLDEGPGGSHPLPGRSGRIQKLIPPRRGKIILL